MEELVLNWISWAALFIEAVAVIIIIVAIVFATSRFLFHTALRLAETGYYSK